MRAIILAAGAGRRLGLETPKSLIPIAGTSILHRQIEAFRSDGVDDFVVVVGHRHEQVVDHLCGQAGRFSFIFNERFAETNTIYSLYLAREHITGTFYYANADVVFDRRLIERIRPCPPASALAIQTGACGREEVKVVVEDGRIRRISKQLDPEACLGEFVGVARFGGELAAAFVEALETCVEREGVVDDYFERAVDRLCADWTLAPVDVSDLPCIEIDFPDDLHRARHEVAPRLLV